jgi:hypothetical protein
MFLKASAKRLGLRSISRHTTPFERPRVRLCETDRQGEAIFVTSFHQPLPTPPLHAAHFTTIRLASSVPSGRHKVSEWVSEWVRERERERERDCNESHEWGHALHPENDTAQKDFATCKAVFVFRKKKVVGILAPCGWATACRCFEETYWPHLQSQSIHNPETEKWLVPSKRRKGITQPHRATTQNSWFPNNYSVETKNRCFLTVKNIYFLLFYLFHLLFPVGAWFILYESFHNILTSVYKKP